jgi:hypothetical protein
MPLEPCLESRVAELEAEVAALESSLAPGTRDGWERFVATECASLAASASPGRRLVELLCRAEHLVARRNLLEAVIHLGSGLGAAAASPPPAPASPAPQEPASEDPTATEPEPPPEPRVDSPVRAVSREKSSDTRQIVEMTSPMELEIDIMLLEQLRKGYGWPTTETERFVVDGVSIPRITLEKETGRKNVEVTVTPRVYSGRYLQRVLIAVELLAAGDRQPVASATTGWFQVGRAIKAHEGGGLEKKLVFTLSQEDFDRLVGGDAVPALRLRLEVGD